ncbi:PAS domain S-box-containing protein [Dethiosulfatibacter aminovorans DSM 17477]|uniref:PAS domain S-box-containing protein n=1 Tax=Dethiosulfatibacter aminovorans DSM 17477 TaxID=1121476 RepID=A0A1M6H619_9FIRM|nr:sigma 54-interacting transcriptional regulator [Dethiosulfatibacter aminovorans]SHJ17624.1 PAS domain S-box-containing protein [Dethiosulfatibacter aminovorans DSM 17477]
MRKELEVFLTSTHDGVIAIDKNCNITLYNKEAEKLVGIPRDKALNRNVEDIVINTRLPYILETGEYELDWQQHLRDFEIISSRMPVKNKDGEIIGAIAIFRNITDRLNLDKQLTSMNEYKSLLQALFQAVQDAISVVDENGNHIMINPAYTRITGITTDEIYGKGANYDIAEGESVHMKVLRTKKPVGNTKVTTKPSGKVVIARGAPIIVGDKLKGSVVILHDISEIKQLTTKLNEAEKRIRELSAKYAFDDIIGKSQVMNEAKEKMIKASKVPATVILKGESGTGKEMFAHAIHNESSRRDNQFIRVNCAAIPETLLESELFGYEEGAFTGAKKGGKKGYFEEANNGTIFLDEISEINLKTQVKLLRVLQEKEITRVGGVKPIHVNVRVISATNVNLKDKIERGEFRDDLYYRLNVFPIDIPPLRNRLDDIELLTERFIEKLNVEYGRNIKGISLKALAELKRHDWPGNVRELENIVGRSIISMNANEQIILKEHLPLLTNMGIRNNGDHYDEIEDGEISTLAEAADAFEEDYLRKAYELCDYNKTLTAKKLGISIRSLYYKMEKYDIK